MDDIVFPFRARPGFLHRSFEAARGTYTVVKDPIALKYVLLTRAQSEVLSRLSGEASKAEVRRAIQALYPDVHVTQYDLDTLVLDLRRQGMLNSTRLGAAQLNEREEDNLSIKRLAGFLANPLFLRFPGLSPRLSLSLADRLTGFLYSWMGMMLFCALMLLSATALSIKLARSETSLPDVGFFLAWPNLFYLWITIGVTKVVHEFGHAVACRRMGCECHAIGLSLLIFSPTLYCDANDSWMIHERWKRIVVALGGMYFELTFAAICGLVWVTTNPGLLHNLAFNVIAVSAVSTVLFNANPLMKLDGYYVFSELLGEVNLQQRALQALWRFIMAGLGRSSPRTIDDSKVTLSLLVYALASSIYRVIVIVSVGIGLHYALTPYRLEGLAIFIGSYSVAVMAIQGGIRFVAALRNSSWSPGTAMRRVVSSFVLGALAAFVLLCPIPYLVSANCVVRPSGATSIRSGVEGLLQTKVHLPRNVSRGDIIAELRNDEIENCLIEARRDLAVIQQRLAKAAISDADGAYDVLLEQLKRARSQLQLTEQRAAQLTIRAPFDGRLLEGEQQVETIEEEIEESQLPGVSGSVLDPVNAGAFIHRGAELAVLLPAGGRTPEAVLFMPSWEAAPFCTGDQLWVRLRSSPQRRIRATIVSVAVNDSPLVDNYLSNRHGGEIATNTRTSGEEAADEAMVRILVRWQSSHDAALYGVRGRAYRWVWEPSLLARTIRTFRKTLYFG